MSLMLAGSAPCKLKNTAPGMGSDLCLHNNNTKTTRLRE
uniref:Uncharacterized protein n=1 Tax=Anguilla anguilla TaxID=7936 RepID=A0A0E9QTI7_ANGAN